jgi:hypothetical protein
MTASILWIIVSSGVERTRALAYMCGSWSGKPLSKEFHRIIGRMLLRAVRPFFYLSFGLQAKCKVSIPSGG